MASVWTRGKDKPTKASTLQAGKSSDAPRIRRKAAKESGERTDIQDFLPERAVAERKLRLWADLTVLALILLLVVGAFFGYQALKRSAPDNGQTVRVAYQIELENAAEIDLGALLNQPIHLAAEPDGRTLGTVTDTEQDGSWTCVTVQVDARYEKGKGYWIDSNRLLVGAKATFRMGDASVVGRVVSLRPLS